MLKNVDRIRFARERSNDTLRREEVVVGVGVEEPEVVRTRIDLVGSVSRPAPIVAGATAGRFSGFPSLPRPSRRRSRYIL